MASNAKSQPLGCYVRLRKWPLGPDEVPSHAAYGKLQPTHIGYSNVARPDALLFALQILREGVNFIDRYVPKYFTSIGHKKVKYSNVSVELLRGYISQLVMPQEQSLMKNYWRGEHWFARRSYHTNIESIGDATNQEFDSGLLFNHTRNQEEYDPCVYHTRRVCDWDPQVAIGAAQNVELGGPFTEISMAIYEIAHKKPFSHNRVFPVLVVKAKTGDNGLIVVQIPVDLTGVSTALFSTHENQTSGTTKLEKKRVKIGQYVSVERVKFEDNTTVWTKAIACDLKNGMLKWPVLCRLRDTRMHKALTEEVGKFMRWTANRRKQSVRTGEQSAAANDMEPVDAPPAHDPDGFEAELARRLGRIQKWNGQNWNGPATASTTALRPGVDERSSSSQNPSVSQKTPSSHHSSSEREPWSHHSPPGIAPSDPPSPTTTVPNGLSSSTNESALAPDETQPPSSIEAAAQPLGLEKISPCAVPDGEVVTDKAESECNSVSDNEGTAAKPENTCTRLVRDSVPTCGH